MQETPEIDDLDVFLDEFEASDLLKHATLPIMINDPYNLDRFARGIIDGNAPVARTPYENGIKSMDAQEKLLRRHEFFKIQQAEWSELFRERLSQGSIDNKKITTLITAFAQDWVDGRARRQNSKVMMSIKASIQLHDKSFHRPYAGRFVLNNIQDDVSPMFTPTEMKTIFVTNSDLLDEFMQDYIAELKNERLSSINNHYVRRGVFMPNAVSVSALVELHYLSSYSLALRPVEMFAQTWSQSSSNNGIPSIFSAPLPAVQQRVVCFSPFIKDMSLDQLELVVAPPIEEFELVNYGIHGGVHEYGFS